MRAGNDMNESARVLIVEDQYLEALDAQDELTRAGFECVGIANTAAEAVLLAGRERPNLILMDIRLASRTDGVEIASEIFEQHGIRCLFVTGQTNLAVRQAAARAHPLGWLEKPYSPADLIAAVIGAMSQIAGSDKNTAAAIDR
jgi:two-component system, response regulator PdtaR